MILKVAPFDIESAKQEIVNVRRIDTVTLLRQLISEKYGKDKCPVERLRLIYMGKVLEDLKADGTEAILYNTYNIRENMTVNVSLKAKFPSTPSEPSESVAAATTVDTSITSVDASTNLAPLEASVLTTSPNDPEPNPNPNPNPEPESEAAVVIPPEEEEYICPRCNNNPRVKKCKECGCQKCFLKNGDPLVCDQCQMYWHMTCAKLEKMPEENYWYCPDCRNEDIEKVIAEGQGIDQGSSKKKAKMPSTTQTKHWGGGMACVGKEKTCIIVDKSHFGPIPGIHVGQSWKFRITCSEWGVHRPPVGGIAGGETTGCPSIVLASGYPEDKDSGDEFTYTGSGGRDLKTGNKRVASQTTDQQLDRSNLALAMTCYTKLNKNGGDAGDNWRKSSPIRVVRSDKLAKHNPKYAPAEGQRYDGIYKLVKYYKEKGRSGHIVWRFLMRRDDPDPAPWTDEGKRRIKELGLRMIYPRSEMVDAGVETEVEDKEGKGKGKGKGKAKADVRNMETAKIKRYEIPEDVERMMKEDTRDARIWQDVLAQEFWSEYEFLHHVFNDAVICCVCSDKITNPVTTPCGHVACQQCLRQVSKENARCPWCRSELNDPVTGQASYVVNKDLLAVLKRINWAYAGGKLPVKYGGGSTAPGGASWGQAVKEDKKSKGQKVGKGKPVLKIAGKRKAVMMEEEEMVVEERGKEKKIGIEVMKESKLCDQNDDDDFVEMPKRKEKVALPAKKAKMTAETVTSQSSSLGRLTTVEVVIECRRKHPYT